MQKIHEYISVIKTFFWYIKFRACVGLSVPNRIHHDPVRRLLRRHLGAIFFGGGRPLPLPHLLNTPVCIVQYRQEVASVYVIRCTVKNIRISMGILWRVFHNLI